MHQPHGIDSDMNHLKTDKPDVDLVDDIQLTPAHASNLSQEHREYLLGRHGSVNLDPIPDMDDADPYNWSKSKKVTILILVSFHAMMSTFTAAAIQSAFTAIAADLNVSLVRVSYLTSLQIAILGGAPLFWRPLSNRYGRRPVFLLSLICSLVTNIGCANSPTYATMALCRALTAFFISPAGAIGAAVVVELFFKSERGRYMGVWTLMLTMGVPIAPFIFGFVAERVGYRWIYYILAVTNSVQLFLYSLFGHETLYVRGEQRAASSSSAPGLFSFKRIDQRPLTWHDFVQPLRYFGARCVLIAAVAYSMIFLFGSVILSVEIPQLFAEKFAFGPQSLGLQFTGMLVGGIVGEQVGGFMSDKWMARRKAVTHRSPAPEFRLWLSYLGYLLTIGGTVIFLVRIEEAAPKHYNVTPIVGAGIASAGNQIVTTVLVTYAVDCYREDAASVGVFITFVRQCWGFVGPFWFPNMFANVGLYGSAGIAAGLMVMFSVVPTILLSWRGKAWRPSSESF